MSDPLAPDDDDGTPLDAGERDELIPTYIALLSELNEAEQANFLEAQPQGYCV